MEWEYLWEIRRNFGYLYPKTTDFIFSVIGEELGFIIAAVVVVLYVVMITKAIYVAKTAKDDIRRIYCNRNSSEYFHST